MKFDEINQALAAIIELRNQIYQLEHGNANLSAIEAQLGQLESELLSDYGTELREVLLDVHDELCPDNEVLSPTSYIASSYSVAPNGEGIQYDVDGEAGVLVQTDDFPQKDTKLVLLPNPLRIMLNIDHNNREEVWSSLSSTAVY